MPRACMQLCAYALCPARQLRLSEWKGTRDTAQLQLLHPHDQSGVTRERTRQGCCLCYRTNPHGRGLPVIIHASIWGGMLPVRTHASTRAGNVPGLEDAGCICAVTRPRP